MFNPAKPKAVERTLVLLISIMASVVLSFVLWSPQLAYADGADDSGGQGYVASGGAGADEGNDNGTGNDVGNGNDNGVGNDVGNDNGTDNGNDNSSDTGNDNGSGTGNDNGNDNGSGTGNDNGNDNGSGTGNDNGNGSGAGNGNGNGSGTGNGSGNGSGDGSGTGSTTPAANAATTQVPSGSCYIEEYGDGVLYNNSNTDNAIQLAVNAALEKANNKARYQKGSITIVVKDGTYEGTVLIEPKVVKKNEDGTTSSNAFQPAVGVKNFTIIIRAAGVLNATGDALAQGDVGANVTASFTIKELATEISGLFFSGGAKNDIDAKLTFAADSSTKINVTDARSFTFNGTSGNDGAAITLTDVGISKINLGAGDDTVTVTYAQSKSENAIGHEGALTGGAGDDTINIVIQTTKGSGSEFEIFGGDGNDAISAKAGKGSDPVQCSVKIAGGAGDDVITLDTSLQGVANNTDDFKVDGGEGADRVHLTGSIYSDKDKNEYGISGNENRLELEPAKPTKDENTNALIHNALVLNFANIEAYTDDLKGKKTQKVELGKNGNASGTIVYNKALESFTDYEVSTSGNRVVAIVVTDNSNPFLSSLRLEVEDIYYIYAPQLNVIDEETKIHVGRYFYDESNVPDAYADMEDGVDKANAAEATTQTSALKKAADAGVPAAKRQALGIYAKNVILRGFDDDTNFVIPIPVSAVAEGQDDLNLDLSCFNFVCNGNVTIDEEAVIDASEFVSLEAKSEQVHGMLPIPQINFVTVKVGNAGIDVNGTIKAGAGIAMITNGTINITCDASAIPLSVAVTTAVMDNHITLSGAIIQTAGSLIARAMTSIYEYAASTTGLVPASLAINVAVSYTDIEIKDSTINVGGMVAAQATSSLTQSGQSSLPKKGTSNYESGGFFAINVAVHEANAIISGDTDITAGGDVRAKAVAMEKSTAKAVSGKPQASTTVDANTKIKNFTVAEITKLAPAIIEAVKGSMKKTDANGNKIEGGFNTAKDSVNKEESGEGSGGSGEGSGSGSNENSNKSVNKVFDTATSSSKGSDSNENSSSGSGEGSGTGSGTGEGSGTGTGDNPTGEATTEATGSTVHAVGSAAITVIINSADAHIDTTGTIRSGANVVLDSSATTIAVTLADATTLTKTSSATEKKNPTTVDQAQLTTTVDKADIDKLNDRNYLSIEIDGGEYTPKKTTVEILPEGDWHFVNSGGTVSRGNDASWILSGGTTTIDGVTVDMTSMSGGSITWKGGSGDVIRIMNAGKTTTSDGKTTTDYTGGTVTITGGTMVLEEGRIKLINATVTLDGGTIYLKNNYGTTVVNEEGNPEHAVTGTFTIQKVVGGDLKITGFSGRVERYGGDKYDNAGTFRSITVACDNVGQISRDSGEESTTGTAEITKPGGQVKTTEMGHPINIDKDLMVDVTAGANFDSGKFEMTETKDTAGNDVKTTFLAATTGEGGEAEAGSTITLTGNLINLSSEDPITIIEAATYHVMNGVKSTGANGQDFESYQSAEGKKMSVYIDGTFSFRFNGSYIGALAFDNVKFERKGEFQTGSFVLKNAETNFQKVLFNVKNGRILVDGDDVKLERNGDKVIVTGGKITIVLGELSLSCDGEGSKISIRRGQIEQVSRPAKQETTALGAALSVVVIDHDSKAYVSDRSTVNAAGLKINASTPLASSDAQAHAGFSNADNSIAGAIAIQVNGIDTRAYVEDGANVTLSGGPLSVTASAKTNTKTVADCSSKAKAGGDGVGVGAGLAIDVTGIDTIARIPDGVLVVATTAPTTEPTLESINIAASQSGTQTVTGKAGSAGGTSVTPALSLGVTSSTVEAYLGSGNPITVMGNAAIKADNSMVRTYTGDAQAAGSGVGFGGVFGIIVANDRTTSRLNRSIKSKNLSVTAKGVQQTTNTAKAGAVGSGGSKSNQSGASSSSSSGGGSSGDSSSGDSSEGDSSKSESDSDAQADKAIAAGSSLGQLTGSTGLAGNSITEKTSNRQTAQTSEGSVSIAAAFGLTIAFNEVIAEICNGLAIETVENLQVIAYSDTDSKVFANASATKSAIGIGAAVALNIVEHDTTALIGDTTVKAGGDATVLAAQIDGAKAASAMDVDITEKLKSYVNDMIEKVENVASMFENGQAVSIDGLSGILKVFYNQITSKINDKWENRGDLVEAQKEPVARAVLSQVFSMLGTRLGIPNPLPAPDLEAEMQKIATDIANDVFGDLFSFNTLWNLLPDFVTDLFPGGVVNTNKAVNQIYDFLRSIFDTGTVSASTFTTWSVAGAGASDVGVAGNVSIAVVNGDTTAKVKDHTGTVRDDDIQVGGIMTVAAQSAETFDTVATAAVTDDGSVPDKNADAAGKADSQTTTTKNVNGETTTTTSSSSSTSTPSTTPSNADGKKSVGVGASFAMVYTDLNTIATIGTKRTIKTGGFDLHASANNKVETFSVAGTDPLEEKDAEPKDIAIDASVALNIVDATVKAIFEQGSTITSTGANVMKGEGEDAHLVFTVDPVSVNGDSYGVAVYTKTKGTTLAKASGFACGDSTAVGAAVAVNIPMSDTVANFKGSGKAAGKVLVDATLHTEDEAVGTATAMGADLQRYFKKFNDKVTSFETWLSGISDGTTKFSDPNKKPGDNKTNDKINEKLDANASKTPVKTDNNNNNASSGSGSGSSSSSGGNANDNEKPKADPGASLSSNVTKTQDVKTQEKAPTTEGTNAVADNTPKTENPETVATGDQGSKSVQVAAAIAVNITKHMASALLDGLFIAGGFNVLATNNANYRSYATGAAATGGPSTATIGAAVAVGVNNNKTHATINGTAKALDATAADSNWKDQAKTAGDVNVKATYTQNMDGLYAGLLGAQTIAGSASGAGSTATVAGAISVLVSNSETLATITENSMVTGGDITVKAYDKSKLALRAGALSASGGSTVGVGASFALIYGNNIVRAIVGDGVTILGDDLTVNSEKAIVTFSDYAIGKDWSYLLELKPAVKKGAEPNESITQAHDQAIITVQPVTTGNTTKYNVDINIDTDTILGAIDLLNFLSSTNYYAESIAGAVSKPGGGSEVSVAGSFAFVFANNTIEALVGDGCTINLAGDADIQAACGTNTRMIAGSFSVSDAAVGAGASVAVYVDEGTTTGAIGTASGVGNPTKITADGGVSVAAHGSQPDPTWGAVYDELGNLVSVPSVDEVPYESSNVLVIAVAPAVTTKGNVGVGAVVPVIITDNAYEAKVADKVEIIAAGDVIVYAQDDAKLLPISFSVGYANDVAVGATVQVLVEKTKTVASIGKNAVVVSNNGSVRVAANSEEFLVTVLAAASVAPNSTAVAGVINVIISRSDTEALVGENAVITAAKDVSVSAESETFMVSVSASASVSGSAAVGAVVNVFVFDRDVLAQVGKGAKITAKNGDVIVLAKAKDYSVIVAVGGAGSGDAAVAGTIPVIVSTNRVAAIIGTFENKGTDSEKLVANGKNAADKGFIKAVKGSVGIIADYDTKMYVAAGAISASGTAAVGATVLTTVVDNDVLALVGHDAIVTAGGGGGGISAPNRTDRRKGITVSATANETYLALAVSGAAGGSAAVAGVVNTGVYSNRVHAIIYGGGRIDANSDDAEGDLSTFASSDSNIYMIAGSLDGAGTVGVGATVIVLTYDKDIVASVNADETGVVNARNVEVKAGDVQKDNKGNITKPADRLYLFSVSISGAGTTAVGAGATVLYFDNTVLAELGGTVNASGTVTVNAENDSHLINAAGAVAGSGTASVTGVVAVTYFRTSTIARIIAGSTVNAGGAASVTAISHERIDSDVVGITGSGSAAISGTIAVVVTGVTVKAYVGTEETASATTTTVNAASLTVTADDDYVLLGIAGTAAVSGGAGIGITAIVSVSNNTIEAYLGKNTNVTCSGDVTVKATGLRDVQMYLATVAGGTAGVGVTVLVSVVGGGLDQDSADAINKEDSILICGKEEGKKYDGVRHKHTSDCYSTGKYHYFRADEFWGGVSTSLFGDSDNDDNIGSDTPAGSAISSKLESTDFGSLFQGDGTSNTAPASNSTFQPNVEYVPTVSISANPKKDNLYELVDGEYVFTDDIIASSSKTYYMACPTEDSVVKVEKPSDLEIQNYFEKTDGHFVLTKDKKVKSNKTYYMLNSSMGNGISAANNVGKTAEATTATTADVPVITGEDAARAFVATGSTVTAHDITVNAKSSLLLDLMAFTASGGTVAVSTTVAVGITHANAVAYTESGSTLTATGDVEVTSWTGSTTVNAPAGSDEAKRNAAFEDQVDKGSDQDDLGNIENVFSGRSVRVVGAAGAAGMVGVSPCVAVLILDSNSYAYIAGNVTKAANVTVEAETHFPVAATATFGLAAGAVAVSASAAVIMSNGIVYSGIVGAATVQHVSGKVSVLSDTTFDATTFAASLAAGAIAVNGAVAVSVDHMTINTFVGQATTLNDIGELVVKASTGDTGITSHATIIGGSAGAIAVKVGVAVATIRPTILTYVGTTPLVDGRVKSATAGAAGTNVQSEVKKLTITNDIKTKGQALTLGITAGAISVGTNVLVVSNDTCARAGIFSKNIKVAGGTTIDANFSATADTKLLAIDAGGIAVGVNVFISNLTADNRAVVDTTGSTVETGSLSVYAGRKTNPNTTVANADGLASVNAVIAISVNVAKANNATVNNAEVIGTGKLDVKRGTLNVEANGRATADAQMKSGVVEVSGVKIVSNVVYADLDAVQEARLENAAITTGGGSVNIVSNFNLETGSGSNTVQYGATAFVGPNGANCDKDGKPVNSKGKSVSVELVGVKVSVARANMNATVRAIADGVTLNTAPDTGARGAVNVKVDARSHATADAILPTVSIALVNVGVLDIRSEALGTFEAILGVFGENKVGVTNVTCDYKSDSYAGNGPVGGLSASIIDVSVNAARSKTGTIANAGLTGTGTLDVAGTINVKTTGDSVAKVEGRTYNVSISGIKVLTNDVEANQSVEQSAYSTFAGKLEAPQSALSISSLLGTASNPIAADATVGSSAGASISLYADITVNKAKTNSTSTNKAYIEGAGRESTEYNVGTASISATTYSKSSATAKTCLAISLYATIGDLDARANSSDSVTASVSNLALDSASDVNVTGYGKSDVYATAVTKGSVGGTSVEEIAAHTQMGSDKHKQSVKAKIGENTDINAKRNVKVEAKNFGMTEGAIDGGKSVGITSEVDLEFSSNANFDTNATVGENATVNADGNISILAESKPEAASDASASSISLTVSTDKTHSEATTVMNVGTSIGSGAKLAAKGAVIIIARGNVRQETISDADAKGIFGGDGAIEAYSNLDRTVTTTIGDGATIAANHGNVDVKAVAGDEDHITNESYVESGAFVGISAVMTHANINSTATTTVGKGVTIEDTFGYVNIISDSSMRYFYNTASCDARGVGAHPDAETDTFVTIKSNVNVGASGDKTFITGRYVTIDSLNSTMKVIDRTYAYGAAAGAKVRAYTDLLAHVDNKTAVNNAVIRGYDSVAVRSTSAPKIDNVGRKSDGKNVYATSYTAIYAAGKANSYAYMNKDVATFTTLVEMGGTTILGADIDVVSSNNLKYGPDPDGYKSSHLASLSKHSSTPIAKNVTATVTLNAGNAYYVGDAAAGIVIDIDGTESKPQVSAVGLRGETPIWSIVDNTVHIGKISNPLKGTIDVSSELKGKKTKVGVDARNVYDQNMIPYVLILNHTSLDVSLGAITVENANYLSPSVNGASVKNTNKTSVKGGIDEHGATTNDPVRPEVVVINYGTGNVTTTGLIANQTGTVSFTWTDADNNGSLFAGSDPVTTMNMVHSVAPIWANRFVVDGAKDIGTESVRMELYATWVGNDKPTTSVKATGDVWFGITDVIIVVGEAPSNGTARDSAVEVSNIEGKNTDLVVNVAMTIYRSADSPIISMPTPGTLEYTSDKIANLASDTCINADALDAYLVGETESEKTFLLPNGTVIHTDLDGVVTRIIEGGIDVTFDDYVITATVDGDLIATLGKGVAINLSTGVITIDEDASLDMLLSSLDGNWLKAIVEKDGTEIVVYDSSKPVTITDGESGNPMTVPKAISLKAVKLTELNGITYYQLTGSGASLDFASYTIDAAFGNSNSNSITAVLATGSTDKLLQWITSWDQSDKDSKLPVWQIVGIVNKLLTDEDFYGTVSEEDIDTDDDLVSWLPSWSNFNDWLIGKLKNPDYATVVAELDALAGEGENALSTKLADANFKDGLVWQWILDHAESEPESAGSEDGQSGEALSGEAQGGEVLNGEAQGGVSRIAKTPEYFLEALFTIEDYKTVIAQIGTPGSAISGEGSQYISDEERQQVIDQILASTILGEWLFDKLSEDTYADVLAQLDDAYGDVISNYLKADMTQDDCVKLVNWILANGKFDDDGLKNLVLALVVKSDYDEKSELVECLPAWSGFGEWLLAKLNGAEPDVLDEIDALADDASDKLSAKLADEGFTGDQAWQWIQDHVRREHSADYYLALLVTDEDYAYGKDAKADKLLSNGVTTTFVEWLAERLLLEGNEELLANADDDYVYDASELLAHGTADELANWFEQNVPDIKKISIVSALLDKKDLTFIIYPKIGIAADGTSITDFTILSEWLYERLTSGLPAASEVIDELKGLTNAEFTGCVYLLSYDKNSKTVGAWQVAEAAKTSTGVAKDYLDINWGGDLKVSLNDGLVFSEIWGGDKFIGFLLKQGPSEPKDENGYDRFGMNVDAVKGILATPDSIEVDDFLGTGTTVYLTPTYARNGVRITNTSIKENVITGISEFKMMATATIGTLDLSTLWTLTAISKTAEGYYYIDWAKAQQSDEYKYSADVRSFYEKLRNVIWTQSVESTFTSMTVKGMCGNKDPKTYTHEYSNDYVTSADLYDDEDCLRFAYLVGKKKDKPSLFRYVILHPYEHWVKLSYINLMPADVILEQNYNYTEVAANAEFDPSVTGVQTCALPILRDPASVRALGEAELHQPHACRCHSRAELQLH